MSNSTNYKDFNNNTACFIKSNPYLALCYHFINKFKYFSIYVYNNARINIPIEIDNLIITESYTFYNF